MTPALGWRALLPLAFRFGIAGRMAIWAIMLGAVTAGTISLFMYRSSVDILTAQAERDLAEGVNTAATRTQARIDAAIQDILMIAKMPDLVDLAASREGDFGERGNTQELRDRLARSLAALVQARPSYMRARVIGTEGDAVELIAVDHTQSGEAARTPEAELGRRDDRLYVQEAAKLPVGQIYLSGMELGQEGRGDQRPVLYIATPVLGPGQRPFGVIVLNVDAARLFNLISNDMGPGHTNFVTSEAGDYLAAPDSSRTFGFNRGQRYRLQNDLPEFAPLLDGNRQSFAGMVGLNGDPHLASALRLHFDATRQGRYIVIASLVARNGLLANIDATRNSIILIAAGLILAGAVFAIFMSGAVVRPLRQLTAAANQIAVGRRALAIEPRLTARDDETGVLARSIAAMVKEIAVREDRLEAQARELVRSNQELAQFAYIASHDLQEPLRMVGSYMELLTRRHAGRLDGEALEFIGYAVDGAARMKRLINDLLGYSRAGSNPLRLESVGIGDLVEAVLRTLAQQIEDAGATVAVGELPTLTADAVQIERLLLNLVENALKYRSKAPLRIHISAERAEGMWRFSVADNGIGIDPRFKDKVFEIFKRLHTREEYSGTGIGLAVAKLVVERHGGHIAVEPNPGGGAVFTFTLPA